MSYYLYTLLVATDDEFFFQAPPVGTPFAETRQELVLSLASFLAQYILTHLSCSRDDIHVYTTLQRKKLLFLTIAEKRFHRLLSL